jgi:hypothetical protein
LILLALPETFCIIKIQQTTLPSLNPSTYPWQYSNLRLTLRNMAQRRHPESTAEIKGINMFEHVLRISLCGATLGLKGGVPTGNMEFAWAFLKHASLLEV